MKIKDILARARGLKVGEVTAKELDYARKILEKEEGDISSALSVIGLCGNSKDADLVEPYLYNEHKNIYGEMAIRTLCRYLGQTARYGSKIRSLIINDIELFDNSRMAALHVADLYLQEFDDPELGCAILKIMLDKNNPDKGAARLALIRILNLKNLVADPVTEDFDVKDNDSTLIMNSAITKFGCEILKNKQNLH